LHDHGDPLIRAMSQFELALLKARDGSAHACEMEWDGNPDLVILALESAGELPASQPGCRYRMQVSRDLSGMVVCNRELAACRVA
jgi:hypothetical protein